MSNTSLDKTYLIAGLAQTAETGLTAEVSCCDKTSMGLSFLGMVGIV